MEKKGRSYQMYVLNLDNSRLFWISLLFLLIISLFFMAGYFIGKNYSHRFSKAQKAEVQTQQERGVTYEDMFLKSLMKEGNETDFEFYRVLPKESLSKEDIEHSIPYTPVEPQKKKADASPVVVERKYPETVSVPVKPSKQVEIQASSSREVHMVSSHDDSQGGATGRYSVQVASFGHRSSAESLQNDLNTKKMGAYIIQAKVNNKLFYRVRVGPFTSMEQANRSLSRLRTELGFASSYVCMK